MRRFHPFSQEVLQFDRLCFLPQVNRNATTDPVMSRVALTFCRFPAATGTITGGSVVAGPGSFLSMESPPCDCKWVSGWRLEFAWNGMELLEMRTQMSSNATRTTTVPRHGRYNCSEFRSEILSPCQSKPPNFRSVALCRVRSTRKECFKFSTTYYHILSIISFKSAFLHDQPLCVWNLTNRLLRSAETESWCPSETVWACAFLPKLQLDSLLGCVQSFHPPVRNNPDRILSEFHRQPDLTHLVSYHLNSTVQASSCEFACLVGRQGPLGSISCHSAPSNRWAQGKTIQIYIYISFIYIMYTVYYT